MSPFKSEVPTTQTELNRQAVERVQQAIDYYRGNWLCEEEGESVLSLMSDLYQWALSHGGSTEELRAYGNFLHDEAIEQEEAEVVREVYRSPFGAMVEILRRRFVGRGS